MTLAEAFKACEAFKGLAPDEAELVITVSEAKHFKKNEVILKEGDIPDGIYVIASGMVELVKKSDERVALLEPGSTLGEVGFFEKLPQSETARATVTPEVNAYYISYKNLDRIFSDRPAIAYKFCKSVNARLVWRVNQLSSVVNSSLR